MLKLLKTTAGSEKSFDEVATLESAALPSDSSHAFSQTTSPLAVPVDTEASTTVMVSVEEAAAVGTDSLSPIRVAAESAAESRVNSL